MTDEQIPENTQPEVEPQAEVVQSPTQPEPQQPSFPFNQKVKCQHPTCARSSADPARYMFKDPGTGALLCKAHGRNCESCGELWPYANMQKFPPNSNSLTEVQWYCRPCYSNSYAECPNCGSHVEKEDILSPTQRWGSLKKGGCSLCAATCYSCDKVFDKDNAYPENGDYYCEDCYGQYYTNCEECGISMEHDDSISVEDKGEFCARCFKKNFTKCEECDETIEKAYAEEGPDETYYCDSCAQNFRGPLAYANYTQHFKAFSYTKKDRFLTPLYKLLPISVKDLKTKHPSVARGLGDLISMSGGKPLTRELVDKYRTTLMPEEFPVGFTAWDDAQRSTDTLDKDKRPKIPQLVMNILPSSEMMVALKSTPSLYELFDQINDLSNDSNHPYVKDQIGWARLELDPNGEYILVDEIQNDHANTAHRLKTSHEFAKVVQRVKNKYNLEDNTIQLDNTLLREDTQEDPDIKTLRNVYKKRYNRNDEELNQMLQAKRRKFDVEEDLMVNSDLKTPDSVYKFIVDPQNQDNPDVKALREVYKTYGKFDDEKLDNFIIRHKRPPYDPSIWDGQEGQENDVFKALAEKYNLDEEGMDNLLSKYANVLKDFPNIVSQAITKFAQENEFKKIFWHTYESGMALKNNEPPKSIYDTVPKDNLFVPSQERPFGLEGKFFEREAQKANQLYKLARRLYLKNLPFIRV